MQQVLTRLGADCSQPQVAARFFQSMMRLGVHSLTTLRRFADYDAETLTYMLEVLELADYDAEAFSRMCCVRRGWFRPDMLQLFKHLVLTMRTVAQVRLLFPCWRCCAYSALPRVGWTVARHVTKRGHACCCLLLLVVAGCCWLLLLLQLEALFPDLDPSSENDVSTKAVLTTVASLRAADAAFDLGSLLVENDEERAHAQILAAILRGQLAGPAKHGILKPHHLSPSSDKQAVLALGKCRPRPPPPSCLPHISSGWA